MQKIQSLLGIVNSFFQKILDAVAGFTLCSMVLLIFIQVIFRYLLKHPLSWSEELAQYIFSWLIFAGSAVAYRENKHVNVDLAVQSLKNIALRRACICIGHLLVLYFLLVVVWYSYPISVQLIKLNKIAVSMPGLKLGYVYLIIPFSSALSILMVLENILKIFMVKEASDG